MKKRLQNVYVGVLMRRNPKNGKADGWGALGGYGRNDQRSRVLKRRRAAAAHAGNRARRCGSGKRQAGFDSRSAKIAAASIRRETREELGNLGIYDFNLDEAVLKKWLFRA